MPNTKIPELEPHCGSWIIVSRETGRAVAEFFERSRVERIDTAKYEIKTAAQHLASLNLQEAN